jgi:signal transduction histidine kinase
MPKVWVWPQLIIAWLPVWALYSTMILTAHPGVRMHSAIFAGARAIGCAAVLGLLVNRLTQRFPWPVPMRVSFIALHLGAAAVYAATWIALTTTFESTLLMAHAGRWQLMYRGPLVPFLIMGVWFYIMVAAVAYASQATQRASIAEAHAASSRLATLRSQLNPHFLFNALHTVVQLIPSAPRQATHAAEELAGLLRTSLEETRDLIPLADELAFVERYLALERVRFGDRLQVMMDVDGDTRDAMLPSFALQTLVENAVRHGASPQVEPTTLHIHARADARMLSIVVRDTGAGADPSAVEGGGTGLARLRDRLRVLFGNQGRLSIDTAPGRGFTATMEVPQSGRES